MERFALCERVAHRPAALERLLEGRDSLVILIGDVTLSRATLEQLCALGRRQPIAESEGARVLRSRLAVRAERRCAGGRCGCEAKHRVDVAGRLGVVREPGQIAGAARWIGERREGLTVQVDPPVGCDRFLDGEAGELVPERDACRLEREHARRQALVETVDRLPGKCFEQPELRLRRDDRDRLEEPLCGRAETRSAGEDRVPNRVRYLRSLSRVTGWLVTSSPSTIRSGWARSSPSSR